jgi:RimJ/RimL family protein N-acetyltransferase
VEKVETKINIETNRLHLRPIKISDAKMVFEYRKLPEVNKYQIWSPTSKKEVEDFIRFKTVKTINKPDTWHQLVIINKTTKQIIGDIGIHFLDTENKQVEIGYTLSPKHQNQGFATEAVTGTIDYLFKKLQKHRIIASLDPENERSIKLLERIGMRKEGLFLKSLWINNEWLDDLIFAVLEEEWIRKY